MKESQSPLAHQTFMAKHLANRKLAGAKEGTARLETPTGKPVVVHEFVSPEHGRRVDVSRGSHDAGDLVTASTVEVEKVEGAYLPSLGEKPTSENTQAIINDLRNSN